MFSNCRITKAFLLAIVFVCLSLFTIIPNAHANGKQLTVGDTWTISGTYQNIVAGAGTYLGKYNESGPWSEVFTVTSISGSKLTISAVRQYMSSAESTGWFSSYATANGPHTLSWTYVINTTNLNFIIATDYSYFEGHPNWLLVNTSTLVTGGAVPISWPVPPTNGMGLIIQVNVPWKVTGSQQITANNVNVQAWGATYTGNSEGYWYNGQNVHDVGPETDIYYYDTGYGIIVGWSVSGTYHLNSGGGNWTETFAANGNISSSNLSFGS